MSPARAAPKKKAAPRARDIGLDVRGPKAGCDDRHCPFHGRLPVRGQVLEGTVVSLSMEKTAVVERTLLHYVPKFERYEKRRRRYLAHNPPCLEVPLGHQVRIAETRPLSKLVSFCIVEDLGEASRRLSAEDPTPRPEGGGAAAAPEPEGAA
jgi:small subunit ribosomal protein S17